MMRSMRSPQPEIDNSLAHTFVAMFSLLAVAFAAVAVAVGLSNKDDTSAVAADGTGPAHCKSIDFGATPGGGWKTFDSALQPTPKGTDPR
jgi:hypothetical protein